MKTGGIGVFDSGVGGLTVLNRLVETLPGEDMIYFGDTKRLPYGTKDAETVKKFSKEIVNFLMTKKVKALVVACNTMTSVALEEIKELSGLPTIGVIEPGSNRAINRTKNKNIGLIATDGTVKSKAYERELKKLDEEVKVKGVGCPKFVELIEGGKTQTKELDEAVIHYLKEFKNYPMDTLILGCTHYPIIEKNIKKGLKELKMEEVELIDPALETAKITKKVLEDKGLLKNTNSLGTREFYVTGEVETFKNLGEEIFIEDIKTIKKVKI